MVRRRVKGASVPADSPTLAAHATKSVAVCLVLLVLYHDDTLPLGLPPKTFERLRSLVQCSACRQIVVELHHLEASGGSDLGRVCCHVVGKCGE